MKKVQQAVIVLAITAVISLIGNLVGYKVNPISALPGALILMGLAVLGVFLSELLKGKVPPVLFIVTIGAILTIPGVPGAAAITAATSKVNFMALATPILAYAGIYTGESMEEFKKTGLRMFVTALVIIFGTYIGSAVIAHLILSLTGQI